MGEKLVPQPHRWKATVPAPRRCPLFGLSLILAASFPVYM